MTTNPPPSDQIIPQPPELPPTYVQPSDDAPRPTRGGCLWGVAGAFGCLLLVLVIPVMLVLLGVTSVNGIIGGLGGLLGVGAPPQAQVVSTQTIVEGIQPLGQLVSVSAQLAKADVQVNIYQGAFNSCGFRANHVVQGAVEAGIDLTKIEAGDLTYDAARETYVLTVPQPELTSCRVDYIRQYDRSFTTCSVDWDEARLLANYMALTSFRDDAVEGGILARAESETRLVLGNFVRLLTGHPVEIVFAEPEATVMPASCQPDQPQSWSYDPNSTVWRKLP
ncbi:MAG: DUF4230 domain-containing protein [Anaerolineae bacterium]|nr:DUF4230 domain-containing protein [Anaerolineae bacterium]